MWVLASAGLLFIALSACSATPPAQPPVLAGPLQIYAPDTELVGTPIRVRVTSPAAADHTPVTLTSLSSYGPRLYQATFRAGQAWFTIPVSDTLYAGTVNLIADAGQARAYHTLKLQPRPPVGPVIPYIGARSIIADGEHWSITIVVPRDKFGNPVAEGTPVRIWALHPDGQLEEQFVPVRHLLAWTRIVSRFTAGRTAISARAGNAFGPEGTLLEVAGWPVPFAVTAEPDVMPANGWYLTTLRTDVIRDRYGNVMPDGTFVQFVVAAPNGQKRVIPAYTLNGVAEASLQAAQEPGVFEVWATVYNIESGRFQIVFTDGPAVGTFPVEARVDPVNRDVILRAGPMVGPLEQYVPDGTPVLFRLTGARGLRRWIQASSDAGYATVTIRLATLPSGDYRVTVLAGSGQGTTAFVIP